MIVSLFHSFQKYGFWVQPTLPFCMMSLFSVFFFIEGFPKGKFQIVKGKNIPKNFCPLLFLEKKWLCFGIPDAIIVPQVLFSFANIDKQILFESGTYPCRHSTFSMVLPHVPGKYKLIIRKVVIIQKCIVQYIVKLTVCSWSSMQVQSRS